MSIATRTKFGQKPEQAGTFLSRMRSYITNSPEDRHFYDFQIKCVDKVDVKAHKIVLASQTKYFEGLFRQEETDFVHLDFSGETMKTILHYLYTGEVEITGENVQDLLMAANYLLITELVSDCTTFILWNIELSNCVEILSLADITSNNKLIQRTLLAISSNIQEIMKMEEKVKSIPLHLFKKVLQNENLLIRNSHGVVLSKSAGRMILTDICNNYSDLNHLGEKDREDLLEVTKIEDRGLQLTFWKSNSLGEAPDGPQVERNFSFQGNGVKFIKRIALKTVFWQNRCVIGKIQDGHFIIDKLCSCKHLQLQQEKERLRSLLSTPPTTS